MGDIPPPIGLTTAGVPFEVVFLGRWNGACCCYGRTRRCVSGWTITVYVINKEKVGAWAVKLDLD